MNWKIALYSIAAATFSCAAANLNLFPQGDFEEWVPYPRNDADKMKLSGGLAPKNWKCSGAHAELSRDVNVKYSGDSSVKIVFAPGGTSELLYLPFPVKPATKYRFSFRIKGENLSFASKTQAPWGGVQASPSAEKPWIDKKGELIFTRKSGTFDWTLFRKEFTTRPTDRGAMIRFNLPNGSGTLWIDDFRIEEVQAPTSTAQTVRSADFSFRSSLNRENAIYRSGETITYTVSLLAQGKPAAGTEFELEVFRGPERIRHEILRSSGKEEKISLRAEVPGQLLFRASVKDPGTGRRIQSLSGALIDPEKLKTNIPEPDDFDRFWESRKQLLRTNKMQITSKEIPSGRAGFLCRDVEVSCPGTNPLRGYLTMPSGAKAKQYPVMLNLHGAGNKSSLVRSRKNLIVFDFNVHGIQNGQPDSYYRKLFGTVLKGYELQGRNSRETCYFLGIYQRLLRALEFVKSLPEWNGKDLIVYGYSMGGGQALAAAGLDPDVTLCVANDPALADLGGILDKPPRQPGWPRLIDPANPATIQTAGYFDSIFFARRISCETHLTSGLTDTACPSTGVCIVYHSLKGKKNIIHSQKGHCGTRNTTGEKRIEEIVREAAKQFGEKK